jgi:FtsZ-interacting cell division protein ZipA
MQEAALACAAQLQGVVVDDQLRTLTEAALASIGRQIEPVYDQLEAQGLAAGSVRALALFR